MNLLLSFKDWLSANWMILVLIAVAVALLVPTYIRSKKEMTARQELNKTIKKGLKIVTTAGVYGVVESIENTTDGQVVTIITGNAKNPTTMTVHINAIAGIDNKTAVKDDLDLEKDNIDTEESKEEAKQEIKVEENADKKRTTAKKSTKSKK